MSLSRDYKGQDNSRHDWYRHDGFIPRKATRQATKRAMRRAERATVRSLRRMEDSDA